MGDKFFKFMKLSDLAIQQILVKLVKHSYTNFRRLTRLFPGFVRPFNPVRMVHIQDNIW